MKTYKSISAGLIILLLSIYTIMIPHTATAIQDNPITPNSQDNNANYELFDLDFPGGTLNDYIEAIRSVRPNANIIVDSSAQYFQIEKMQLKNVALAIALEVINNRVVINDNQAIDVRVIVNDGRGIGGATYNHEANPVYRVLTRAVNKRKAEDMTLEVYPLGDLLKHDLTPEDILTVIQLSLEVSGIDSDDANKPIIKFHEETGLLLVRAEEDVTDNIFRIIDTLYNSVKSQQNNQANIQKQNAEIQLQQIQAQMAAISKNAEIKLAEHQSIIQNKMLELEQLRIQLQTEMTQRATLENVIKELKASQEKQAEIIVQLKTEIASLKK